MGTDPAGIASSLVQHGGDPQEILADAGDRLTDAGFRCVTLEEPGVLVARRGAAPRLALAGHVDTVPVASGWQGDPRSGAQRDGALWGRGSSDMLGAVGCFLALASARPELDLAVALTTDEEAGMEGARAVVDAGLLPGVEAVILGEPTGLRAGLAHRGVLWFDVVLRGEAAHASLPAEGRNAIGLLAQAVERLRTLELPGPHGLLPGTTLEPTLASAGTARNQVPDLARLGLDCRYPPPATPHDLAARVDGALVDLPHALEVVFSLPPFQGKPDGSLAGAVTGALDALGLPDAPVGLPFGTEAGRYAVLDVEQVILGPGEPAEAHTSHEHVSLEALRLAQAAYEAVAEAYQDAPEDRRHGAAGALA